jgi:hypothetical protein
MKKDMTIPGSSVEFVRSHFLFGKNRVKIGGIIMEYWDESANNGQGDTRRVKGNDKAPFFILVDENGPVEPAREKVCIVSITESNLTDHVYIVPGDPVTRIELINDGPGELTVTVSDGTNSTSKVLKPDDVYDQNFTAITTLTFSAGAVFRADILR